MSSSPTKEPRTPKIRRGPRLFAVLPTLLTLGNMVCGFGALTFAGKVGIEKLGWGRDDVECLYIAAVLIFVAMVFDMLDGRAARWAKQTSQFGAELDSLCDAVSFGVAPAFIVIKFCSLAPDTSIGFHPRILWGIAVCYAACAILRLARFNVETDEDDSHQFFSGLPSPAAAGAVVSFLAAYPVLKRWAIPLAEDAGLGIRALNMISVGLINSLWMLLPIVTLACAMLMVSRIRYSHFFNRYFRGKKSRDHLLLVLLGLVVATVIREFSVPIIFCSFAFAAPIRFGIDWLRSSGKPAGSATADAEPTTNSTADSPDSNTAP